MAGRTWLQQGPPITLGLKIAGWLAAIRRHRERLQAASERALVLQFGGAVGTLAALGEKGTAVSAHLARTLGLTEPDLPWHTHRDNLVEVATVLGLLAGTLGKIARDVSLLMETEVAEVSEPWTEGRGGSSTMPHKRNPVASAIVLAAGCANSRARLNAFDCDGAGTRTRTRRLARGVGDFAGDIPPHIGCAGARA